MWFSSCAWESPVSGARTSSSLEDIHQIALGSYSHTIPSVRVLFPNIVTF